jgi:hypothetical protein
MCCSEKWIGMADNCSFTTSEIWKGGNYELFIPTASTNDLCLLLKALWTFPSLEGCYLRQDCEPTTQPRVRPAEHGIEQRLYGLVTLPNSSVIPCASYVMDYTGEADSPSAHWISFVMTMCALSIAYPVGAYPFGPIDEVSEWKAQLDSFLTEVARWVHGKMPLEFALMGFEVDAATVSPKTIRTKGIPKERNAGILWNDGVEPKWYPATRP